MDQGPTMVSTSTPGLDQFNGLSRCAFYFHLRLMLSSLLGAIMFNDPLSIEQCERLVKQLSTTVFPFQCAHGR